METRIALFNNIISRNNQYTDKSHLWFSIQDAYARLSKPKIISNSKAKSIGKEYCNMISLYAPAYSCGGIDVSFEDFIIHGIEQGYVRQRDGFIYNYTDSRKKTKKYYLGSLGFDIDMEYVEDYNDIENPEVMEEGTFYQMKIKSRTGKLHFIACCFYQGELFLSDTSNRGIWVKVKDKIKKSDFYWLLKIG